MSGVLTLHCSVWTLLRHARLQNFPAFRANVERRRYIGVAQRSQITFGCRVVIRNRRRLTSTNQVTSVFVELMTFGKSLTIKPRHHVAYLKARILNGAGQPVIRARPTESQDVTAGLKDTQHLRPKSRIERRLSGVPLLTHEVQGVRRIRHHRVHDVVEEPPRQHAPAIAVDNLRLGQRCASSMLPRPVAPTPSPRACRRPR